MLETWLEMLEKENYSQRSFLKTLPESSEQILGYMMREQGKMVPFARNIKIVPRPSGGTRLL